MVLLLSKLKRKERRARIMDIHADGTNQIDTRETVEASMTIAATIMKSHTKTIPSKRTILSEIQVEFQIHYIMFINLFNINSQFKH